MPVHMERSEDNLQELILYTVCQGNQTWCQAASTFICQAILLALPFLHPTSVRACDRACMRVCSRLSGLVASALLSHPVGLEGWSLKEM